jgi:GWxTD domain-containing protein
VPRPVTRLSPPAIGHPRLPGHPLLYRHPLLYIGRTLGLAGALLLGPVSLAAQAGGRTDVTTEGRRLVQQALALAERGDTAGALEQAARASRLAPELADARFLYGLLLARLSRTGLDLGGKRTDAIREFEAAVRLDAENPRYLIEIARLRMKHPFLRLQAERYLRRALHAAHERGDPAVEADIEAEIGHIYFRRYQALANRRMMVGTVTGFDWDAALRDPHYTKDLLQDQSVTVPTMGETDLSRAETHFRAGVRADEASAAAATGLLALLLDAGRFEEFLDAAGRFAHAAPDQPLAHLYLGLGLWRARRGPAADSAFARALAALPRAERDRIEDLSLILRARDAVGYRELGDSARGAFERTYWWAAEPLRLTAAPEYKLEHYSRVAEADLRFSAPDLRLRGWNTDRGQLYIRYGPPPVIATFPPNPYMTSDEMLAVGNLTTVWYYPRRNLRFVFTGPPTYNYQRLAGDFSSYAEAARAQAPVAYDNVSVALGMDSIAVQVAQFRVSPGAAPADATGTDVVFFAGIPVRDMVRDVDLQGGELETGVFVSDAGMRDVVARRESEAVKFRSDDQFESRTSAVRLAPGPYLYRFEARLPDTDRAARGAANVVVEDFSGTALQLSDVVVADLVAPREVGGPQRHRQDFFIDPNADLRFRRSDPVHLYTEAYHLTPDRDRIAHFQVAVRLRVEGLERSGLAARIVGGVLDAIGATAVGDDQVTLSYVAQESLEGRDRVPIYLALDLAGAPPGIYQLDLAVKDLTTNQVAVRHRQLFISEARP